MDKVPLIMRMEIHIKETLSMVSLPATVATPIRMEKCTKDVLFVEKWMVPLCVRTLQDKNIMLNLIWGK